MNWRLSIALLVATIISTPILAAPAVQSLTCLSSQIAAVSVTANARTIDGRAGQTSQNNVYQGLILGNLQRLGLRTLEGEQASGPVRSISGNAGSATMRIRVSLQSDERRLTSTYLSGDQWPLRTVMLTVSATATDARNGKSLASMDVPLMKLAGNSTAEAVSDYLAHDFQDALAQMLGVACGEPSMSPPSVPPASGVQTFAVASRAGNPVAAGNAIPTLRIPPGRHIAIVIGISQYLKLRDTAPVGSHQLTNLRYADADAQAMAEQLGDPATTGRLWEVHSFINAAATTSQLWHFLRDSFENARSDDVILLFFAGHGRPNGATDVTLMTYDADAEVANSGLSFDWIKDEIKKSPALQIVGFIDACHSGSSSLGGVRGSKGGFDPALLQLEGDVGKMRTVIASASNEESAYEDEKLGHGVFTYFLLQAIKGAAPRTYINGSNFLVLGKIYDYVTEHVSHYVAENSRRFGPYASQRPKPLGNLEAFFNNWPLARVN